MVAAQRMSIPDNGVIRVAAIGDVHCSTSCPSTLKSALSHVAASADVLALCGDLTNHGLPEEARALVGELAMLGPMPIVAVLGNHDYESAQVAELCRIISGGGIHLLDGDVVQLRGVDFVGVKGFGGGFDRGTLSAFGEPAIKHFVQEAMDEVKKLESALARSKMEKRIALLHYAPIRATVAGEAEEIFPFLGSSRLEEPLNRYQVTACVHGHAHRGALEGRTRSGVPVYNVSVPVMRAAYPNRPPFRLLDVHAQPGPREVSPEEAPVETDVG